MSSHVQETCRSADMYASNATLGVANGEAYHIADMYVCIALALCCFPLFSLTAINPGWGSGPFLSQKCASLARPTGGSAILCPSKSSAADFEAPAAPNPWTTGHPPHGCPVVPGRSVVGLHCTPGLRTHPPPGLPSPGGSNEATVGCMPAAQVRGAGRRK